MACMIGPFFSFSPPLFRSCIYITLLRQHRRQYQKNMSQYLLCMMYYACCQSPDGSPSVNQTVFEHPPGRLVDFTCWGVTTKFRYAPNTFCSGEKMPPPYLLRTAPGETPITVWGLALYLPTLPGLQIISLHTAGGGWMLSISSRGTLGFFLRGKIERRRGSNCVASALSRVYSSFTPGPAMF
jgi:hypothetical protein